MIARTDGGPPGRGDRPARQAGCEHCALWMEDAMRTVSLSRPRETRVVRIHVECTSTHFGEMEFLRFARRVTRSLQRCPRRPPHLPAIDPPCACRPRSLALPCSFPVPLASPRASRALARAALSPDHSRPHTTTESCCTCPRDLLRSAPSRPARALAVDAPPRRPQIAAAFSRQLCHATRPLLLLALLLALAFRR